MQAKVSNRVLKILADPSKRREFYAKLAQSDSGKHSNPKKTTPMNEVSKENNNMEDDNKNQQSQKKLVGDSQIEGLTESEALILAEAKQISKKLSKNTHTSFLVDVMDSDNHFGPEYFLTPHEIKWGTIEVPSIKLDGWVHLGSQWLLNLNEVESKLSLYHQEKSRIKNKHDFRRDARAERGDTDKKLNHLR